MSNISRLNKLVPLLNELVKERRGVRAPYFPRCTKENIDAFGKVSEERKQALGKHAKKWLRDVNPSAFLVSLSKVSPLSDEERAYYHYILKSENSDSDTFALYAAVYYPYEMTPEEHKRVIWYPEIVGKIDVALLLDPGFTPEIKKASVDQWLTIVCRSAQRAYDYRYYMEDKAIKAKLKYMFAHKTDDMISYFREGEFRALALYLYCGATGDFNKKIPSELYDNVVCGDISFTNGGLVQELPYLRVMSDAAFVKWCRGHAGPKLEFDRTFIDDNESTLSKVWEVIEERLTSGQQKQLRKNSALLHAYWDACARREADIEGKRSFTYEENYPVPVKPVISWSEFAQ